MSADYLELDGGRKVRIEINWNASVAWAQITGSDIQGISNLRSDIKLLRTMAWCSAVEGESEDGKELGLTEDEFGKLCKIPVITKFVKILGKQVTVEGDKKK